MTDTDIGERTQGICGKGFCIVWVLMCVCVFVQNEFCLNITRGYFFDHRGFLLLKYLLTFFSYHGEQ
jgi:hypothetical protein